MAAVAPTDATPLKGDATAQSERSPPQPHRVLGVVALAGMIFFSSTGGAYGAEATIRATGPALALAGFMIIPWVWSLPQAMYTAELSTALPVDGGISVWARVAWSDFWGFQGGLWSWMEGCSTLAAYPVLVVDYAQQIIDHPFTETEAWLLKAGIACCLVLVNMRGTAWVGNSVAGLGVFVLLPLIAFSVWGIPKVHPEVWTDTRSSEHMNWTYFINLLLWNLSGFDNMGAVSGEVKEPKVTVPRAQIIAVILGVLAYIIPLAIGSGVEPDWSKWHEGHLAKVAHTIGGDFLMVWILLGAAAARLSNFMAELCTNSFFLQGMGAQAMLPSLFAWRHPEYDTPWVAILFNFFCVLVLMLLRLPEILQIANIFTMAAFVLGVSSLFKLRETRPVRDESAFTIPLSTPTLFAWFLPAGGLIVFVIATCARKMLLLSMLLFAIGHLLFFLLRWTRSRGYIHFVEPPEPDSIHEGCGYVL